MKKYCTLLIISVFLIGSCSQNKRSIFLIAEQVEGLTTKAPVNIKGVQVGYVDGIQLDAKGQVIVQLKIDPQTAIPSDSKFNIVTGSLLGDQNVDIEFGVSDKPIIHGDTLAAILKPNALRTDSSMFQGLVESLTGKKQRDSILIELRRLNENLEKLENN